MRILYAAYRNNPNEIMDGSGADFNFYSMLRELGHEIKVIGPYSDSPVILERKAKKIYTMFASGRYLKFPLSLMRIVKKDVEQNLKILKPDLVFSLFHLFFYNYQSNIPSVLRLDTCIPAAENQYPVYGKFAYKASRIIENNACNNACKIITHSEWNKNEITLNYNIPSEKIIVFPNPSFLPEHHLPPLAKVLNKQLKFPIRLLFVGRDEHRKGLDIAIETVKRLCSNGIKVELSVCGIKKKNEGVVKYYGTLNKNIKRELLQYISLYENAHFLLHPPRFDPSPIVTSEAAAFGVPVITNNSGGIASSVVDKVSGIILKKNSLSVNYADIISGIVSQPKQYKKLVICTRQRYKEVLNQKFAMSQIQKLFVDIKKINKPSGLKEG